MGDVVDIELIVLFEVGADVLSEFAGVWGVGGGCMLQCKVIDFLFEAHEVDPEGFKFVLELFLFELNVLLHFPLFVLGLSLRKPLLQEFLLGLELIFSLVL